MVRQVFFDVLDVEDKPIISGLLYEKQIEPAIREWLRQQGKAGLTLTMPYAQNQDPDTRVFETSEHLFTVVER